MNAQPTGPCDGRIKSIAPPKSALPKSALPQSLHLSDPTSKITNSKIHFCYHSLWPGPRCLYFLTLTSSEVFSSVTPEMPFLHLQKSLTGPLSPTSDGSIFMSHRKVMPPPPRAPTHEFAS
ncbi:hypothetical protein SLE2022_223270 [Rubroshorea leprosula]